MHFETKEPGPLGSSPLVTDTSQNEPDITAQSPSIVRRLCVWVAIVLVALIAYGVVKNGPRQRQAQAHLSAAEALYDSGKFDQAIVSYRKVIELCPEWGDTGRQWIEMAQGRQWLVANRLPVPVVVQDVQAREQQQLEKTSRSLLAAGNYAALEKMHQQMLTSRATLPDGQWKTETFYTALSTASVSSLSKASNGDSGIKAVSLDERESQARLWSRQRPKSVLANVILAHTLIEKAWKARGHSFASDVKSEGWQGFTNGIDEAGKVLQASENHRAACPGWYRAAQSIAQGQSWPKKDYAAITTEGLQHFPGYFHLQSAHAVSLLPRWNGRRGDWERYVAEQADAVGGEAGDVLYARLAWRVEMRASDVLRESSLSWPRVNRGFQVLMKRHPRSLHVASGYCYVAGRFKQFAVMQRLFKQNIKGQIDLGVWQEKKYFVNTRSWAFGETSQ